MGLFKKTETEIEEGVVADLRELRSAVDKILKLVSGKHNVVELTDEVTNLKTQIADLEINKSKLTEAHEREAGNPRRDAVCSRGAKRSNWNPRDQALRRSRKEENLDADKQRFEDHIKFVEETQAKHLDDIKELLKQVMDRIPTVTVDVTRTAQTSAPRTRKVS